MVPDVKLDGALCADMVTADSDPWFSDDPEDKATARAVCNHCPVQARCLVYGLVNPFEFGIFGGLDGDERRPLRHTLFGKLPPEMVAVLRNSYQVMSDDDHSPLFASPSVEAKYGRRFERAQYCKQQLAKTTPQKVGAAYQTYVDVVTAVLDNPTATGAELGHVIKRSGALFNQRLRECFDYFGCDMSVL